MNPSVDPIEGNLRVYCFSMFSTVFFYNLIQYFQGHSRILGQYNLLLLHYLFSTNCFVLLCVNRYDCVLKCLFALVLYWEIVINLTVPVTLLRTICVFCIIFLHKIYKYFKCALQIKETVCSLVALIVDHFFFIMAH